MMYWAQLTDQQAFLVTPKKKSSPRLESNSSLKRLAASSKDTSMGIDSNEQNQSIFLSWVDGTTTGNIKQNNLLFYIYIYVCICI